MEKKFFTTLEQSKKLIELGVDVNTAACGKGFDVEGWKGINKIL